MKEFNGLDFLKSKAVKLTLSNNLSVEVSEISDFAMDKLSKLEEENAGVGEIKAAFAEICNISVEQLKTIGIVELRGALDFLTESLFATK